MLRFDDSPHGPIARDPNLPSVAESDVRVGAGGTAFTSSWPMTPLRTPSRGKLFKDPATGLDREGQH